MIKAVILDLDDTLCMTEQVSFAMENEALRRIGRQPMSRELHTANWGKPLYEAILERSPGIDVTEFRPVFEAVLTEFVSEGKLDDIPVKNLEALQTLDKQGMILEVVTSRTLEEVAHLLEPSHMLQRHIKVFRHRDNTQFHKPDPRVFAYIEAELGLRPEECLYVGDSVGDAAASLGAGLHFVANMESGIRTQADFKDYPDTIFVAEFPDVVDVVRKLRSSLQ